jgi:hypothetical protein
LKLNFSDFYRIKIIFLLLPGILPQCKKSDNSGGDKPISTGGPCDYNETAFTFQVLKIEKQEGYFRDTLARFDITAAILQDDLFRLKYSPCLKVDTISYYSDQQNYASWEYLQKKNIIGKTFSGKLMEICTGTCNPCAILFNWENGS